MRKGEPLTDARVLGDALLQGYGPGTVAAPIRIADPAAAHLLHPGDRIDVLSTPTPDPMPLPPAEEAPTHLPTTAEHTRTTTPRLTALAAAPTARTPPRPATPVSTSALPTSVLAASRTGPGWRGARVVVSGVPVVAIPPPAEDGQEGALIVLATDRAQALALAAATPPLSLTITAS
jgi:hypothetical protein